MKSDNRAGLALVMVCGMVLAAAPSDAGSPEINLELLVNGLDEPVVVTHANDGSGRLFIVEQDGAISCLLYTSDAADDAMNV